ncbi:MAG: hypothetical protein Q4F99_03275, partial [bacterium]|nr:hypothetical protein [bacterium]
VGNSASGAITVGNSASVADHDVNYVVEANAGLALTQDIEASSRTTARTVTLGEAATLTLGWARALGNTPNLTMTLANGASVKSEAYNDRGAQLRGTIKVPTGTATIAGGASIDVVDDTTYDIGEGATLQLQQATWTIADDKAPLLKKTGAGALSIESAYTLKNATFDIEGGLVRIANTVGGDSANAFDVTVKSGATLDLVESLKLGAGAVTFESGATLLIQTGTPLISGTTTFARDARMVFDGATITTAKLSRVTGSGVVIVDLKMTPDVMTQGSCNLIEDSNIDSTLTFRLGGANASEWLEAGWTIRQTDSTVSIVSATADDTFIWGGEAGADWSTENAWYNPGSMTPTSWTLPTESDPQSAMFANKVMVKDANNNETEVEVSRTVHWDYSSPFTLMALRSDAMIEDGKDRGYTIDAVTDYGDQKTLTIHGEMVLTGDATTTINGPIKFGTNASLTLLRGSLLLKGPLHDGGTMIRPIAMGDEATMVFAGSKDSTIESTMTPLSEDAAATVGTFRNIGSGTLTFNTDVSMVKAFEATKGAIAMGQEDLFAVETPVTLTGDAAFAFTGAYTGATNGDAAISVEINEGVDPAGVFAWEAKGNAAVATTPRLTAAAGRANVQTFEYNPQSGRLTLEADEFFPETTTLSLLNSTRETDALLLGKGASTTPAIVFGNVLGEGLIGVEPALNAAAGEWSTHRVLTFKLLNPATTFAGTLMGGSVGGTTITAGLAIERAETLDADVVPRFVYAGASSVKVGTLAIADQTCAEIFGTWAGHVNVAEGGRLTGSGTIGAETSKINVPAGAILSAVTYSEGKEKDLPVTMTIKGTLQLEKGSVLDVVVDIDEENGGAPLVSCVQAENVQLPNTVDEDEVMLNVVLRLADDNAYATGATILQWNGLNGFSKINGTITVYDKNGDEVKDHGYLLRQDATGLHVVRSRARTWLIVR